MNPTTAALTFGIVGLTAACTLLLAMLVHERHLHRIETTGQIMRLAPGHVIDTHRGPIAGWHYRCTCGASGTGLLDMKAATDAATHATHRQRTGWDEIPVDPDHVHVVPIDDQIAHPLTEQCVCVPTAKHVPTKDGDGWLIVHHALDGRN